MTENNQPASKDEIATLLRRCAELLESLHNEESFSRLLADVDFRVSIEIKPKSQKPIPGRAAEAAAASVVADLNKLQSREAGTEFLSRAAPTKAALVKIARFLDLPARKGDNLEDLARRIVESTIGFRLVSAAVKGRQDQHLPTPESGQVEQ